MSDTITPGSRINVKVTQRPTSAAAAKTIVRLLSKDQAAQQENSRLKRVRDTHFRQKRRGGRYWNVHVVKQHPVKAEIGQAGVITATLDVLTDLKSVSRFVEVSAA